MRKTNWVAFFISLILFILPGHLFAETVTVEGTIQGLMSFCENKMCTPGEEMIIAAMEDTYVLVTEEGDYYLLPNLKKTQLAKYLGKKVRVEGELKLNGKAMMAKKAEVQRDGEWKVFHSPDMMDRKQWLENLYIYGAT